MGPVLPVGARLTRRVREEPPPGDWAAWVSPPAVSPYFSYSRPEAHPKEPQPVDEEDGSTRSADPDRPDGVSDGGHRLPARCCERAGLTGTPPCQMAPPVRERRPLASSPGGGRHSPPEAGGVAYRHTPGWFPSRRCPHPRRWRSRVPAALPLSQHCAARPASRDGADRRSAFPCLRVAPPGGMGAMRQFSVRVAPSATRRALPSMRNPGQVLAAADPQSRMELRKKLEREASLVPVSCSPSASSDADGSGS